MKKVILLFLLCFLLSSCVSGEKIQTEIGVKYQMWISNGTIFVFTFQDPGTGVWYVSSSEGITPRLNADGSIYKTDRK